MKNELLRVRLSASASNAIASLSKSANEAGGFDLSKSAIASLVITDGAAITMQRFVKNTPVGNRSIRKQNTKAI